MLVIILVPPTGVQNRVVITRDEGIGKFRRNLILIQT